MKYTLEFSPLEAEQYYVVNGKRVCSVFEKNGIGWFFRTPNIQSGVICEAKDKAEKMAIDFVQSLTQVDIGQEVIYGPISGQWENIWRDFQMNENEGVSLPRSYEKLFIYLEKNYKVPLGTK